MQKNLNEILENVPSTVNFGEVKEFDDLDDRVSCIESITINIVGVEEGYIEFCPNDEPPAIEEMLAWIWLFRPDLGEEIVAKSQSEELRRLVTHYREGTIDEWWQWMSE